MSTLEKVLEAPIENKREIEDVGELIRNFHSEQSHAYKGESLSHKVWHATEQVAAGALYVALSPGLYIIDKMIQRATPGESRFRQTRIGLFGEEFTAEKFKTLEDGFEQKWEAGKENKERKGYATVGSDSTDLITLGRFPLGKVLRALKIDEFPQLKNVWRGEMSFLGPRPLAKKSIAGLIEYRKELNKDPEKVYRMTSVRPGLIAKGQIADIGGNGADPGYRLDLDVQYPSRYHSGGNIFLVGPAYMGGTALFTAGKIAEKVVSNLKTARKAA